MRCGKERTTTHNPYLIAKLTTEYRWERHHAMTFRNALARSAGILVMVVAVFNIYIALYDTTLVHLNSLHHNLNWLIAAISILAAIFLLAKPSSKILVVFSGLAWPLLYILSLYLDFETKMCLGTNINCWPTVSDAYDYLILGSRLEGWALWPYTIRVVIVLLLLATILSTVHLVRRSHARKYPN